MSAFLAAAVAELAGEVTGLPATVAPLVYAGPPATPAIVARLIGAERSDPIAGTTSGTVLLAVYGGSLDVRAFTDARGWVEAERRETTHGTIAQIKSGQIAETTLPNGLDVWTLVMPVVGYAARPTLTVGETLPMDSRAMLAGIAARITDGFWMGKTCSGGAEVNGAVEAVTDSPGRITVTGEVVTFVKPGYRLREWDVPGLVAAATASQVGKPTALGRITSARVLSSEATQDGRGMTMRSRVELVAEYTPA